MRTATVADAATAGRGRIGRLRTGTQAARRFGRLAAMFVALVLALAGALALSGNAAAATGVQCAPTGMETVSTPRDHYQAGETATISGGGYGTLCDVQVDVERPDGVVESFSASTDFGGNFTLDYQVPPPPGVLGQYTVVVRGLSGAELARTTFEDAPAPQFDVAPSHVKTTGTRTFSLLVRNVAGGSGDTARCVRVITGSNFDITAEPTFVVANPGTGTGQTGSWALSWGTNFVQIRNNENAPSGRGLLGQNLSDPNWVRFEITVNVQATGTQMWRSWMNTNGTADCTSGSSDDLSVRAGGTFTRDYSMDFRDASGNVIAAPSTTSGGTVDYRARITRVNSGDDLSYAAIAAPTCLSNISVVSVTDSGAPNFAAHVSDNFVRLVSSSSTPSFSGTKLAANGEWVQVHFTAMAGCSSAQPFRSAAWKNTSPEAAEGDIYKLVPSVSINNVSLTEGNSGTKTFGFTVSLSHADENNVTVNYATANGTATAPSDYTAIPSTALTFAPGETSKTVNVTVNGDTAIEPDETFNVNLTSPSNAFIADNQGVGTILNDDNGLTINDVTLTEGNSGTKNFNLTVTLSPAHTSNVTVQYATANGTATAGSDYVAHPTTTLTFTPGQTTKTVTVLVNGDNVDEADETFFVNLANSTNATITDSQGLGTILNDENEAPVAADDSYSTDEDTPLTAAAPGVLGNDTDADGDLLTAELVAGPSNGTLTLNADGSFTYTPAANYHGSDSFTYQADDGTVDSNVATVTITVDSVNDAPTCEDSSITTSEDTPGSTPPDCSDVDGDALTYAIVDQPANGSAAVNLDGDLEYTPNANFNGADAFTYAANDGTADSNVADVNVTVNAVNDAPTCANVSITTDEDTTGSSSPDCSDVEGDALTYEIVDPPANGAAAVNLDGDLEYTPAANFNGTDSFTYRANDGTANSNTADVAVTVNPINDAPTCANVTLTTDEDTPGSTSPNCSDVDGDTLTYEIVNPPANGSAAVNLDGDLEYTPAANFNGTDSFTYRASDGTANSNTADVAVTVNPVNDAPTCADVSITTDEDTTGDTDPDCADIDGDSLTYAIVGQPANGSATLLAGKLTYEPNADFNGTDSFTYKANDGTADSNVADVDVTVNPVNDAPICENVTLTTNEDTPGSTSPDCSDVDGDALTYTVVSQPADGSAGVVAGELTYTPDADFYGSDSFTYEASDGELDSNIAEVGVTVNPVNDPPVAGDDTASVNEDNSVTIAVLANDSPGPDNESSQTLSSPVATAPSHGMATVNPDGTITYTPDANYNGPDGFSYTVCDNGDPIECSDADVTITVDPINDTPTAADGAEEMDEDGAPIPIDLRALVADVETDDDDLTYEIVSGPSAAQGTLTETANGVYEFNSAQDFNGTVEVTYNVTDRGDPDGCTAVTPPCDDPETSATKTVTITVNPVNDAPVAQNDAYSTDEDTTLSVPAPGVLSNDSDVDGDSLTAVLVSGPGHGTVVLDANGSFTYTPAANYHGSDSFTYKADDGPAESNTATVNLTINSVNDAPDANDDSYSVDEDNVLSEPAPGVLDNDSDVENDPLTAALVSGPSHGTVALNADGSFTYTPAANFNGTDSFTYKANDGAADSAAATVTITVNPVNDAPVAENDAYSTDEDTPLNVAAPGVLANDSDVDGDSLTAVLVSGPSHGTLTLNADGSFTYTPDANYHGSDSFTYKADDGPAESNTATVNLTINSVNDAPSVDAGPGVSGAEGSAIALDGTASDVEGDELTYQWTYAAGAGVDLGATCSFGDDEAVDTTITCTDDGSYTATLTATDEHGASGSDSTTVTVTNANPNVTINSPNDESAPVAINNAVNVNASFTDAGVNDTHTCQIAWGDGSTTAGAVTETPQSGSGTCTGAHSYATPGVYKITVTVTDDDGGAGSATAQQVVYDPNGGFVTGGGWINSPATAYYADPTATGRATFGFVSKYQKGATTPTGQTEFQFKAGDLNFHSGTYDWLVVSGARAQYKGTGTINGAGTYKFMLTATDGQVNGGGGVDKFRIKIWDATTGAPVYDNMLAASDDLAADSTQAIGGGSIVIHKSK